MAFRARSLWNELLRGNVAEAVRLLNEGADPREERNGKTPMQYFAETSKIAKPELFDKLLEYGGVVDDTCLYRACHNQNVNAVRIFMEAKKEGRTRFDVNIIHPERLNTPLVVAVKNEHLAICELLLSDPETNPNLRVENGFTALFYAAAENLFDIVDALLRNHLINPNIRFQDLTPLHIAALNNNIRVVTMLVAHRGTNVYARDDFEATALDIARSKGHREIVDFLSGLPAPPLPEPPLMTPLVVRTYAAMPDAFDILEIEENPVNEFDQNYMVFKIGESYFALPKEKIRNDLEDKDGERILFECTGQFGGSPHLNQIHANQKYFVLSGIGNYLIPLEQILGALVHPTNVFEITGPIRRLDNVASYSAVTIRGSTGFKRRRVNIVSRDHCQAGTDKQMYHLHPVRIDIVVPAPAAAPVAANGAVGGAGAAPPAAANARRGGARRRRTQRRRINKRRHSRARKA